MFSKYLFQILAILHPQDLNTDQRSDLKQKLITEFVENESDEELKVTSLHIQFQGQREKSNLSGKLKFIGIPKNKGF